MIKACTIFIVSSMTALFFFSSILPGRADAAYKTRDKMIDSASVIALVDIEKVESGKVKGSHWTYSQIAHARPLKVLKGSMTGKATLYGGQDFICARVTYKAGRALVFLSRDGALLVGNNWELSVREIENDTLDWFINNTSLNTSRQKLSSVIASVSSHLKKNSKAMTPDTDLEIIAKAAHFCDGVIGEAASSPPEYLAFVRLLQENKPAFADLDKLLTSASPQGKLYAAMLVYKLYPQERAGLSKRFKDDKTKITVQTGCEIFDSTLGQSVDDLTKTGKVKFLDFERLGF